MSDAVDRNRYVLSEADNERIFRERIVPDELTGTSEPHPLVVIVGGQTGDGKASITALVQGILARRGAAVNLNLDTYKPRHPHFHQLVGENDETAGAYTSIDGHKWLEKAEHYAIQQRFDVVLESAMRAPRDFEEPARRFKAAGYQVEVAVVAVHEALSRFRALDGHLRQLEAFGCGRFVDPQIHDSCYQAVLRSAQAIDREGFADRVIVVRPDGQIIYGNQRGDDGQWQHPPRTVEAIAWERARPWTVQESRLFLNNLHATDRLSQTAPDQSIREAAAERMRSVSALARSRLDADVLTQQIATSGVSAAGS